MPVGHEKRSGDTKNASRNPEQFGPIVQDTVHEFPDRLARGRRSDQRATYAFDANAGSIVGDVAKVDDVTTHIDDEVPS